MYVYVLILKIFMIDIKFFNNISNQLYYFQNYQLFSKNI